MKALHRARFAVVLWCASLLLSFPLSGYPVDLTDEKRYGLEKGEILELREDVYYYQEDEPVLIPPDSPDAQRRSSKQHIKGTVSKGTRIEFAKVIGIVHFPVSMTVFYYGKILSGPFAGSKLVHLEALLFTEEGHVSILTDRYLLRASNKPGADFWDTALRPGATAQPLDVYREHFDETGAQHVLRELRSERRTNIPPAVLDRLADLSIACPVRLPGDGLLTDDILQELLKNPSIPTDSIVRILAGIRTVASTNTGYNYRPVVPMRMAVASRRGLPPEIFRQLARDPDLSVLAQLAINPDMPPDAVALAVAGALPHLKTDMGGYDVLSILQNLWFHPAASAEVKAQIDRELSATLGEKAIANDPRRYVHQDLWKQSAGRTVSWFHERTREENLKREEQLRRDGLAPPAPQPPKPPEGGYSFQLQWKPDGGEQGKAPTE